MRSRATLMEVVCDAGADPRAGGRRCAERRSSWHWLFLINLPPGSSEIAVLVGWVELDRPDRRRFGFGRPLGVAVTGDVSRRPRIVQPLKFALNAQTPTLAPQTQHQVLPKKSGGISCNISGNSITQISLILLSNCAPSCAMRNFLHAACSSNSMNRPQALKVAMEYL